MNFYIYFVAFASGVGGLLFGYEVGLINQVLTMNGFGLQFGLKNSTFSPTAESANIEGWIAFTFLIGAVVGSATSWILADLIGRRMSLFVGSTSFMIGGAIQCGASHIAVLYVGRVISGISVGLVFAVAPLYISETSPAEIRGRLTSIFEAMIAFGIFVASSVNAVILTFLSGVLQWRLAMGIQIVPALVMWLLMFLIPFSPRWLVDKGRDEKAIKVLSRLRDAPASSVKQEDVQCAETISKIDKKTGQKMWIASEVHEEFQSIKKDSELQKTVGQVTWTEIMKPDLRRRLIIGVMLQIFQQWTGLHLIYYYAAIMFQDMGFDNFNSTVTFILIKAALQFVAIFPGMWLVERIGRKKLLIAGGSINALSHYAITLFVWLSFTKPGCAWGAVIAVYVFTFSFGAAWGPVVWVYQSEIFPMRLRAKGTACCTVSGWVMNAIVARITPNILDAAGFYTYLIFGTSGIIMTLFVCFFVPETQGKSLEEMDQVFTAKSKEEKREDAENFRSNEIQMKTQKNLEKL